MCAYILKRNGKVILHLLMYVNDIFMVSYNKIETDKLKKILNKDFKMKEIDEAKKSRVFI